MSAVETRVLNEEELEIVRGAPFISEQLPFKFESGFLLTQFSPNCAFCGEGIPSNHCKGRLVSPIPTVLNVRCVGLCMKCDKLTSLNHRIRSDASGTQMEFINNKGRWVVSRFVRPTWFIKLKKWILRR